MTQNKTLSLFLSGFKIALNHIKEYKNNLAKIVAKKFAKTLIKYNF